MPAGGAGGVWWVVGGFLDPPDAGLRSQGYFYPLSDAFVARLSQRFPEFELGHVTRSVERLTAIALRTTAESERYGLRLDPETYATVVAALEAGKHVILTGPTGTAK